MFLSKALCLFLFIAFNLVHRGPYVLLLLLLLPPLLHPFNGPISRTTWYQKGKTSLDSNEARDDGVLGCSGINWTICKQSAPRSRQITITIGAISPYILGDIAKTLLRGAYTSTSPSFNSDLVSFCRVTHTGVFFRTM